MRQSREEMRASAAQLYAIVANSKDMSKLVEIIEELTRNTKDQVCASFVCELVCLCAYLFIGNQPFCARTTLIFSQIYL